jgi:hypothetical protein
MKLLGFVILSLLIAGCAADDSLAKLGALCNSGVPSACIDYQQGQENQRAVWADIGANMRQNQQNMAIWSAAPLGSQTIPVYRAW